MFVPSHPSTVNICINNISLNISDRLIIITTHMINDDYVFNNKRSYNVFMFAAAAAV